MFDGIHISTAPYFSILCIRIISIISSTVITNHVSSTSTLLVEQPPQNCRAGAIPELSLFPLCKFPTKA